VATRFAFQHLGRVGFIALLVQSLTGCLIEHFKELKHQGMKKYNERVKGTTDRFVSLLTAAALRFYQ
jgi:cobalt-zinc-cadmium resistance protein CzcA